MRRLIAGLAAGTFLLTVAACGSSGGSGSSGGAASSGGTTTVKVSTIPIVDTAPLYVGQAKGFYAKHGLKLTISQAQGGAAIVPGVVSGQFQFGFSNVTSLLIAQTNNLPVKAVAEGVNSTGKDGADFCGLVVPKGSTLTSAKQLEGRKVAVNNLNNVGDTTVRASVRKAGGDPSKVKFVELPFDQMPAALDKGQVDAAFIVEPAFTQAKSEGAKTIASPFVDAAPDLTVALFFTSQQYAQKNPDVVKRFQAATKEALAYSDKNPDEVRRIVGTYTKIPSSLLSRLTLPSWPAEANRASIETLTKEGKQDGLFKSTPDVGKLLP
jgi:NitT/TauT family transport system substrate-binding protein